MHKLISILLTCTITTGCASMFSGTKQTFTLTSSDPKTKFYLNGQELGSGSASVPVAKKDLSNTVFVAKKSGCADATTGIDTKFDATSLLGILIDLGIITILVVDLGITGAAHEAVRTNYVLNPACS